MVVLSAPRVVTPGGILADGVVVVDGPHVVDVRAAGGLRPDIVLPSGLLVPGLVDLQVNGGFGVDLVDAAADGWRTVVGRLPGTGVTAFAPTFITAPVPALVAAQRRAAEVRRAAPRGARILGVHLEGPFLSERRRGAHQAAHLVDPTVEALDALLHAADEPPLIVTLAPERVGGLDAVRRLAAAGVRVSVGHTDATAGQVAAAADAGARMVTHLYNAQRGLHHREPGVVGQALTDRRLTAGLIADLYHVAGPAILVAFAAAPGRIALVTDAAAPAGMPPGRYRLGGEDVVLDAAGPPLRADGTIAGSGLRLDVAVANVVGLGVDVAVALDAATRVPADLVGRPDLGRLAPGAAADLVWLGADLRCRATWVGGELVSGSVPGGWPNGDGARDDIAGTTVPPPPGPGQVPA